MKIWPVGMDDFKRGSDPSMEEKSIHHEWWLDGPIVSTEYQLLGNDIWPFIPCMRCFLSISLANGVMIRDAELDGSPIRSSGTLALLIVLRFCNHIYDLEASCFCSKIRTDHATTPNKPKFSKSCFAAGITVTSWWKLIWRNSERQPGTKSKGESTASNCLYFTDCWVDARG